MFNLQSDKKNDYMLRNYGKRGYDWWWHTFVGYNKKTGEERSFFIEYFIVNPGYKKDEPVFGQDSENKKNKIRPSYLMIKCGSWGKGKKQLHHFVGINKVEINDKPPFFVKADHFYADDKVLKGSVKVEKKHPDYMMCDDGTMSWNLKIEKVVAYNVGYGTCDLFRKLKCFEMYWHAQGMKSFFEGTVTFDGEEYIVTRDKSYGYCDKNWGKDFTTPWLWLSSHNIEDEAGNKLNNTVFDIGGGKPKAFGISIPKKLLGAYYIEGKEFEFNFSKFWHPSKTKFTFDESDKDVVSWHVEQSDRHNLFITDVTCLKKDMLFVNYESPLGEKKHNKLWNGGNGTGIMKQYRKVKKGWQLVRTLTIKNIGCEYGEFDK